MVGLFFERQVSFLAREYRDVFNVETVLVNYKSEKYGWRRIPYIGHFSVTDGLTLLTSFAGLWLLSLTPILTLPAWLLSILLHGFGLSFSVSPIILAGILAFVFMLVSRNIEPQGKPIWKFLFDGSWYYGRSKTTNGWHAIPRTVVKGTKRIRHKNHLAVLFEKEVPLPAYWGRRASFQSRIPFRVTTKNEVSLLLSTTAHKGQRKLPGTYQFQKGELCRVE